MRKICIGLLLSMILFGLQSCKVAEPKPLEPIAPTPTPAQVHANAAANLSQELIARGVQVIHRGETMRLIIPTSQLFIKRSSNFNIAYANQILPVIAQLLTTVESPLVMIDGYTSNVGPVAYNRVLSERQAQKVLYYLSRQGVDVRVMVTKGYGSQQPIASNATTRGRELNNRLEISFQYVPLSVSYWSRG